MAKKKKAEEETVDTEKVIEEIISKEKFDEVSSQLSDTNDKLLRTLAEYDNFRKRSTKEREQVYGNSKASVLTELLPIIDNFERATANKEASLEDYQKGIDMIFNQLIDTLKKMGVESFGEKGDEFDPKIHSAVMHIDDENEKENVIVNVFTTGYKMGERVLRPAIVQVAN
ncbi:MAG: nucleotide exchange factor GrpE [Oscillospiraceae bacterium]